MTTNHDPLEDLIIHGTPPPPTITQINKLLSQSVRGLNLYRKLLGEIEDWLFEIDARIKQDTPEAERNRALLNRVHETLKRR